jgi:hypothetical protein
MRLKPITLTAMTVALAATLAPAQTPAPAPNVQFQLPLADKTTGTAIIIPTTPGAAVLVYATARGQIAVIPMGQMPGPSPQPIVAPKRVAVVENPETSTDEQRALLANPAWKAAIAAPDTFHGVLPYNLIDKETGQVPPAQKPFLDAARGTPLPALVVLGTAGDLRLSTTLPATPEAITTAIRTAP